MFCVPARISSSSRARRMRTSSAWPAATARSAPSPRWPSSATSPSSASRGGRETISRSTWALPPTTRSAALAAFGGPERRVDVGRVGDRVFLNNVSLGVYGRLVHRREQRRRLGNETFARLRALGASLWPRSSMDARVPHRRAADSRQRRARREQRVPRRADHSLGERKRLDGGVLALYAARGLRRLHWTERTGDHFRSRRAARCRPPSTVSRPCSNRRSSYASIRGRCGCSSRRTGLDRVMTGRERSDAGFAREVLCPRPSWQRNSRSAPVST